MDRSHDTTLQRFVDAQSPSYATALAEIRAGKKRSHWMWYIFPQLKGLGFSTYANLYGISSRNEAEAYLAHEILGKRLEEVSLALLSLDSSDALEILGSPDDLKLRSSMTLFASVPSIYSDTFKQVLYKFFNGEPDPVTLKLLHVDLSSG